MFSACILLTSSAVSETSSVKGGSTLGIMENVPPTSCWVETDCNPGEVCHMSITVTGTPATKFLQMLKYRVQRDKTFSEWGLEIYVSEDGFLNCDATDKTNPFCKIFFDPSKAKIEPALSCE
jgi:hypothetical protein